jgi:V8-like Glu-specific endopeptidase
MSTGTYEAPPNGVGLVDDLRPPSAAGSGVPAESLSLVEESTGTVGESSVDPSAHAEVGTDAAESTEESAEADPGQLAAPADPESAVGDLSGIEGFDAGEEGGEESADPAARTEALLPDAGTALGGGQEFLPVLASLASTVVPALASAAGPALAKAVKGRLSSRTRRRLARSRVGSGAAAMIARLLAQAERRTTESEAEAVDEAVVEQIVQTLEVIIGTDDRVRISGTTEVPWRWICLLKIEFPSGAVYRGTGFFIGPRTLATAGHCVYLHNQGGWARKIEVVPGCNGRQRPFGSAVSTTFRSTAGWTKDSKPESDYGAIVLPPNAFGGKLPGSFGFGVLPTSTLLAKPVVVAGYPGDKPEELWGMARKIKKATASQLVYDIDTMGGQSGAPVYLKHNGKRYVVGIHNYGASTGNSATRVTKAVADNFRKWSQAGAAAPAPKAAPKAAPKEAA